MECLQTLVHAFVTSRLDYYNSLLYMGCPNIRFVATTNPEHCRKTYPKERMLATWGARSFSPAAPILWNSLPAHIRDIE